MENKNYDTLQQQIKNIFQYAECNIRANIKENNISTISIIFHNKTLIDWLDNFETDLNKFMNLEIENFRVEFVYFDFYDEFAFLFDLNRFYLKFNEIKFRKCKFSLLMASNSIKNKFIFEQCEFNSFEFNNSNFIKTITFKNSKFNNYSTNQNNKFNNLEFENCEFKSFGLSNCETNRINIKNCKFGHWQLNIDEISCKSFWFSVNEKSEYDIEIKFEKCNIDNLRLYQSNHTIIKSIFFSNSTLSLFDFDENITYKLGFYNTKCKNVNFKNSTFQEEFHFEKCEVKNFANFSNTKFINNAYFNNTEFSDYADFHEAEFEAIACFYGAKFEKPMNFSSVVFKDFNKANFINLNIEKINFDNIKTYIDENYENGLQKEEIDKLNKQKAEIEKIEENIKKGEEKLKSTLQKIQNFKFEIKKQNNKDSNTLIKMQKIINEKKQELNNINKQFKGETKLLNNRKKILKNEFTINQLKHKTKWANNFRDSFRAIKHSLIEINNNLEASNFHKLELYAKEIELDYIIELEAYNNKNSDIKILGLSQLESHIQKYEKKSEIPKIKEEKNKIKNNIFKWKPLKAFFDYNILAFYRNISEHHTDFIKILNFTITMIAFFGICIYILENFLNWEILKSKPDLTIIDAIATINILIMAYAVLKLKISYKNSIYSFIFILLGLPNFIIFLLDDNYKIIYENKSTIIIETLYLNILIFLIFLYRYEKFKTIVNFISFIILIIILYISTSLILPFANLNSQEFKTKYLENNISEANKTEIINLASIINPEFNATKNPNLSENLSISELNEYKKFIVENKNKVYDILSDYNSNNKDNKKFENFENAIYADSSRDKTIKCISFIYAIILGLCLFSLQKTARRNSVVPS